MKRGLIGAVERGSVSEASELMRDVSRIFKQDGGDVEGAFYACAFQAGIDEFVINDNDLAPLPASTFLQKRVVESKGEGHSRSVIATFSQYLPDRWYEDPTYFPVASTCVFIVDLLDAMTNNASVLLTSGLPKPKKIKHLLPKELRVPVLNLLSFVKVLAVPGLAQKYTLQRDDVDRFNQILSSDLFFRYSGQQAQLDEGDAPIPTVLSSIASAARELSERNSRQLSIRKSAAAILRLTPAIVEAVFGKLPGVLAETATKLGSDAIADKRRIVIHDFRRTFLDLQRSEMLRIAQVAKESGVCHAWRADPKTLQLPRDC